MVPFTYCLPLLSHTMEIPVILSPPSRTGKENPVCQGNYTNPGCILPSQGVDELYQTVFWVIEGGTQFLI